MNEALLAVFKRDPWGSVVVSKKAQHRILSIPEADLKKNGTWLVGDRNGTGHDCDTKDMSRRRQVTAFIIVRSHARGRRGEGKRSG
jgi:hypothetical protein